MIRLWVVVPLLLACVFFTNTMMAKNTQPNIVLIVSDNQSHSLLGTYGNPTIKTPHIDRLAENGMQFNLAFAVNGVCSPTRAVNRFNAVPNGNSCCAAFRY